MVKNSLNFKLKVTFKSVQGRVEIRALAGLYDVDQSTLYSKQGVYNYRFIAAALRQLSE